MIRSESIVELAQALNAFQAEVAGAKKKSDNPYYHSKYADLATIWQTIREPLTRHGLCVSQLGLSSEEGTIAIETILIHTSGEYISGVTKLHLTRDDPQGAGSAITYARRYGLAAILGVHQEDDDAETHRKAEKAPTELDAEQKALHDGEAKAYKLKLFTADEIKNFNKEYLGVEAVAKCKSKSKLEKASVRFDIWTAQRQVHILMEEVIPQPNHQHNWLNKVLGADSPYAVEDTDKLGMAYADLLDRKKQEADND